MSLPRLDDLEAVEGATVLLRLDLNVPLDDGAVADDARVRAAEPTVRWLLERGAVVAACSHLGKPKGTPRPGLSLAPVAPILGRCAGVEVELVSDCVGPEVAAALAGRTGPALLLLENLRFHPGETANDADFAAALGAPFTHYVNDAFGAAHRAHASIAAAATRFAPGRRAGGRLMQIEVDALTCLMTRNEAPFVAVVGGAKISTKIAPLMALLERVDVLAIGGGMANTFLLAEGREVGRSLVEAAMVETAREVVARAAERGVELVLPADVVVADSIAAPTEVAVVAADRIPAEAIVVDLGPASRDRLRRLLEGARTAFWNGPMGVFELDAYAAGTTSVAEALAASPGFTVVGGGESVMAVGRAGVSDRISHVSTGGGAALALISGATLPALAALEATP